MRFYFLFFKKFHSTLCLIRFFLFFKKTVSNLCKLNKSCLFFLVDNVGKFEYTA